MTTLADRVPASWRTALAPALGSPSFQKLETFLKQELEQGTVFPPTEQIFAALEATSPERVSVVLLGQDPYPTAGHANGLSFSVAPGVKLPGSLRNIFKGLAVELGAALPASGDLSPWARQGVLLLNCVLTVREGEANSHQKKGWEPFTRAVLEHLSTSATPRVFLCLGKPAEKLVMSLTEISRHTVITAPHPSPLNGNAFVQAVEQHRTFSAINAKLVELGRPAITWTLP